MKQSDVALLIIIVFFSVLVTSLVGNKVLQPPKDRKAKVEVVEKISADFPQPDPTVFNDQALNPTREITIGNDANQQPIQRQ